MLHAKKWIDRAILRESDHDEAANWLNQDNRDLRFVSLFELRHALAS